MKWRRKKRNDMQPELDMQRLLNELAAEQERANDIRARILGSNHGVIMAGIADMVRGDIGGKAGLGKRRRRWFM